MSRFSSLKIAVATLILLIAGCSTPPTSLEASFLLLPSVAESNYKNGDSNIDLASLEWAFSPNGDALPLLYGHTKQLKIVDQAEKAQLQFSIEPQSNESAESYSLEIGKQKITIQAQDQAGLFYAFITLNQYIEDALDQGLPLPLVQLQDAPKIAFRPIQIDIKHHLEKKEYYYDLIDELAQLKINGMILEIEDKLQYKRRPEVASSDALSIEEWKAISEYAIARNISISPLVQGLGHASFILKHEKNKHLRDDPESDWAFNPLDPETYNLQFDLYLDALEAFPHGKYLHVGGDEVQTTGRGSGKSALELNLIWLNKVTTFADENNRTPIFWDDMPLKQAGLMAPIYDANMDSKTVDSIWVLNEPKLNKFIEQFPKNCVYMRWNYHMAESYGNGKAMNWFSSNGFQVMGATAGQTRWTLMPQRESNLEQIQIFAQKTLAYQLEGLLLTLWDDDSPHFELYKRGITGFGIQTWEGLQRSKADFKKAYRHRTFGSEFQSDEYAFIDALDNPVGLWTNLLVEKGVHRNSLIHRENPVEEYIIDLPDFNEKGLWSEKYAERIDELQIQAAELEKVKMTLSSLKNQKTKSDFNLAVYNEVVNLVDYNFRLLNKLYAFDTAQSTSEETEIIGDIEKIIQNFTEVREQLEQVYGKSRVLDKPQDYILDQDHHNHPANQSINFDWQFMAELMALEKIEKHFKTKPYSLEGKKPNLQ